MTRDAAGQPLADPPRPEPSGPRSDRALALSHAPILVVIAALGLLDFASARFYGVFLSGTLSLPLAVFLIGFARHRRGRADGRLLMAVADIALLLLIGVYLFQAFRTGATGIPAPGVVLLAVLTLAGPVSVVAARRPPASSPIRRSRGHAIGALALGGLTLGSILVARTSTASLPVDVLLLSAVPAVISLALRLLAWWWGAGGSSRSRASVPSPGPRPSRRSSASWRAPNRRSSASSASRWRRGVLA